MVTSQPNPTIVPEAQHSSSQKLHGKDIMSATEFKPVVKVEKRSYSKPRILKIRKIYPNTSRRLFEQADSLTPDFEGPPTRSYSPILENKLDTHSFRGHELNPSTSQQNLSSLCGTNVEETDDISFVEGSFGTAMLKSVRFWKCIS